MSDEDGDGDLILDLVGIGLVVLILVMVGTIGFVVINGTDANNEDATLMKRGGPADSPTIDGNWSAQRVNDSHVQLTHTGNDTVNGTKMIVRIDQETKNPTWGETITPNESVVIQANSGSRVELFWRTGQNSTRVVKRWDL